MKKPKIAYMVAETSVCGGVGVVCQHANRLARRGFETCIVSAAGDDAIDWFPGQRVPVYPIKAMPSGIDIGVATWWETAYELQRMKIPRKFYFVQSDETRFYPEDRWEPHFVNSSYWFDFEFITEARWIQRWLKDNYGADAGYVPNGVDRDLFHRTEPLEPKGARPRVLIEGPADMPSKGVAEAFRAVSGLDCEIWYVNYRGEPDPAWKVDRYFYRVPMGEMKRIYSSCDVLLKLSTVEGSFGPPLEMMACGGACVLASVTGLDEAIVPGENALVVEPGDEEGARRSVERLLDDDGLRNKLVARGGETVELLDWEKSIDLLEDIYLSPSPTEKRRPVRFQEIMQREKGSLLIHALAMMREIAEKNEQISWKNRELSRLHEEIRQLNLKNDELNAVYLSKQWRIAEALNEARHSPGALLKLPFRICRLCFGEPGKSRITSR